MKEKYVQLSPGVLISQSPLRVSLRAWLGTSQDVPEARVIGIAHLGLEKRPQESHGNVLIVPARLRGVVDDVVATR